MSRTIVAHTPDNPNRDNRPAGPLVRGTFGDQQQHFTVRASTETAPDSFQVSVADNPANLVLIVSGLTSGNLHATWGEGWRAFAPEWKAWFEDCAFGIFYNGRATGGTIGPATGPATGNRPQPGQVRFCEG